MVNRYIFTPLHFTTYPLLYSLKSATVGANMKIQVIEGSSEFKEIRDKITQEIRGLQQEVYFHIPGSAFPVKGKMRVLAKLNPGDYEIEPVYKIGKYGDLEINPFAEPPLHSIRPPVSKSA